MEQLNHQHLLVKAYVNNPPVCTDELNMWLTELVELVDMEVFMDPRSTLCDTPGNEGITGVVGLETSHSSAHFWTRVEKPYVQFDLYSCKEFSVEAVLDKLNDFGVESANYLTVDRNGDSVKTKKGKWKPVTS